MGNRGAVLMGFISEHSEAIGGILGLAAIIYGFKYGSKLWELIRNGFSRWN